MPKDIMEFIVPTNVHKLADELVNTFDQKADEETIDYDFELSKGKLKSKGSNTTFQFDPDPGSLTHGLRSALYERELTIDEEGAIKDFFKDVRQEMSNHFATMRNTIRRVVLPGSDEGTIPLDEIRVDKIEILNFGDKEKEDGFIFSVLKDRENSVPNASIANEVVKRYLAADDDKTINDVIKECLESGDEEFKGVGVIRAKKVLYEAGIEMFVDYSLAPLPQ